MATTIQLRPGARPPQLGDVLAWGGDGWEPRSMRLGNQALQRVHTNTIVKIAMGETRSPNFVSGSAGWCIYADGSAEFNDITARGTIYASAGEIAGWTINADNLAKNNAVLHSSGYLLLGTGDDIVRIDAADDTYRLWIGNATKGSAPFRVSKGGEVWATNAHVEGEITATSGAIGGWTINAASLSKNDATLHSDGYLQLGTGNDLVRLDAQNASYRLWIGNDSTDYAPFKVGKSGEVWAANVHVSGSINAAVFKKSLVSSFAGSVLVTKTSAKLSADSLIGGVLYIESPADGSWVFDTGDVVRLTMEHTTGVYNTWVTVTRTANLNEYTTAYQSGDNGVVYKAGAVAVDYGPSGDGGILLTADQSNSPRITVFTHAGSPWSATTEHARLGNLNGSWGYSADTYGVALGEYGSNKANLTWDPTNGLRLRTYTTTVLQLDNSGNAQITGVLNLGSGGGIYQGTGSFASPTTGLKIWNSGGIGQIGGYKSGVLQWYANTDGELYAGAGAVRLNSAGFEVHTTGDANIYSKWYNSDITTYTAAFGFANLQKTDPDGHTYGAMNFGLRHNASYQSGITCYRGTVSIIIQDGGTWKYVMEASHSAVNIDDLPITGSKALGARVIRTSDQSIAAGTWVSIVFTTESSAYQCFDNDGCWSSGSRVYAKHAGVYQILFNVVFDASAVGNRYLRILRNGSYIVGNFFGPPTSGSSMALACSAICYMAVNDYVEGQVQQSTSGALDVKYVAYYSPSLALVRVA